MTKYLCIHTLPPNAINLSQMNQFAEAAQHDPAIRGYRSFACPSEGKVVCVMEGPDREAVAAWFKRMGMPYDTICPVEIEGERGVLHEEFATGPVGQGATF